MCNSIAARRCRPQFIWLCKVLFIAKYHAAVAVVKRLFRARPPGVDPVSGRNPQPEAAETIPTVPACLGFAGDGDRTRDVQLGNDRQITKDTSVVANHYARTCRTVVPPSADHPSRFSSITIHPTRVRTRTG